MIKFTRDSDIPEYAGKTWREKNALRRLARKSNKSFLWINIIFGLSTGLLVALSVFVADSLSLKYLHHRLTFLLFLILLLCIVIPFSYLFQYIIFNPRLKKHFEDEKRKS